MPTSLPRRLLRALVVSGALAALVTGHATTTRATTDPPAIDGTDPPAIDGTDPPAIDGTDVAGADLTIQPAAVRTADGRAELDVVLGVDAPGDVLVTPRLATAEVAEDGTVTIGAGADAGRVTDGARLRPGERLRVVVHDLTGPTLVVAEAVPADTVERAPATATATALVLPGPPPATPAVSISATEGTARVEVRADAPLLVTATVAGRDRTTYPDRLVLPDQPVTLAASPARWPLPTEAAVTDETGRTVRASTGTTALTALAAGLVAAAVLGVLAVRRRVRP